MDHYHLHASPYISSVVYANATPADSMPTPLKSLSTSIIIIIINTHGRLLRRHLSWVSSATPVNSIQRDGEKKLSDTSQKTHKSIQIRPSMEVFKTTHVDGSYLSASFCSSSLKYSAKMGFFREGKQLHSHMLKLGYVQVLSLQNQLLNLYVKCKVSFSDACRLFDEMFVRNVVSWNIMICGLVGFDCNRCLGLLYFRKMLVDSVQPDYITIIGVIGSIIELSNIEIGQQLHCFIIKLNFDTNSFVGSSLVDLYGKCSFVEDAWRVFDRIPSRDLVLWNVMVSCYALNGFDIQAFGVFGLMRAEGLKGDAFTFSSLLTSCGMLGSSELGKQTHGIIIRLSYDSDVLVASALIDMYAKNGNIHDARVAFDGMVIRNVVSWNTMIVGYGRYGDGEEAMELLRQMLRQGFDPDELTLASILSSCGNLASITKIGQVHALAAKNGWEGFLSIGNALLNAYYKSGSIPCAIRSFGSIINPNIITWTSMIGAYAFHGHSKQAVEVFEQMLLKGVKPDRIAFIGVLSACSHGGLVDDGFQYFASMTRDHHIMPDSDHYSCLIDLLGRAGHLDKAYDILENMPFQPGTDVLGAFLAACKGHRNLELAKLAADKLFKLEPDESVNYTMLSNIYASVGCWVDVARVRKAMRDQCDYKVPGCSWIEVCGEVHTFLSSDKSHPQTIDVYMMLEMLVSSMKEETLKLCI